MKMCVGARVFYCVGDAAETGQKKILFRIGETEKNKKKTRKMIRGVGRVTEWGKRRNTSNNARKPLFEYRRGDQLATNASA